MVWAISQITTYSEESVGYSGNVLIKGKFMKQYTKLLDSNPEEAISKITKFRDALFTLNNMRILVVADVEKLYKPVSMWEDLIAGKPMVNQSKKCYFSTLTN